MTSRCRLASLSRSTRSARWRRFTNEPRPLEFVSSKIWTGHLSSSRCSTRPGVECRSRPRRPSRPPRHMTTPPSPAVRAGFGVDGDPIAVAGGEGLTFRVSDLVLKKVHDVDEAEWTQALLSRVVPDGFRIPEPVPSRDGRWVHAG